MPLTAVDNPLTLRLLGLLVERPMHPYALAVALNERYPFLNAKSGSVYTLVRSLEAAGWVAQTGVEQHGNRPARTVYALTGQGWDIFRERVRRQIREAKVTTSAFVDALAYLGALDRAEAPHVLRERQDSLEKRIAELDRASDPGLPEITMIEVDFVLHQLRAEADWIRALIARIDGGELAWPAEGQA
ncbi:PadR family transcriptional regulator [Nonomuraea gerenzanensis]|uniref:Transcriptional regulator, PadR family n=1 Tax=Nonomuraea gerenzanensis TaxID=93944 RepID=A0A1M4EBL7_9ACTN|nr:PadR family transcriptional regulator [Nonomuraea gerenzanensis]UBU18362.1 PadR family transcriptional regulator [Nonomuraea gerenzanensis]SBO96190.1 Transcriptional regulator, PadR family [Nonomuraea gerenzanensis]